MTEILRAGAQKMLAAAIEAEVEQWNRPVKNGPGRRTLINLK